MPGDGAKHASKPLLCVNEIADASLDVAKCNNMYGPDLCPHGCSDALAQ
jgi:hypothetical protein